MSGSAGVDDVVNVVIPEDKIDVQFSVTIWCNMVSVGPGGQNVNKVNTKAEIRFHVMTADWLPREVRKRLLEYQANKVNSNGELIITSQEQR
jgi:peptidyl-tRNA hydrolase ICT1